MKIFNLDGYFSLTDCQIFFFKVNRVEDVDEMNQLSKIQGNPIKNVDYRVNKKNTNRRTDGRRKP